MIRYINSEGKEYKFYDARVRATSGNFHKHAWTPETSKRKIGEIVQGFEKDAAENEITFTVRGALEDRKTFFQNPHFTDAKFTLVIYGPVVNPQVIIGEKSYLVNIVLEQGERLEIDSHTRTVTKISKNGEQVNAFHNREKGKKFFKKIPPGRQKVVWSGKFDWDLVIYEERSEPRWSGWKQR